MFVINRRKITIIAVIMVTVLTFIFCFNALSVDASSSLAFNGLTVVIDAGHGGIDGGVTGVNTGVKESELNLSVALKLKELFEDSKVKVVMTRTTEAGLYGIATSNRKKKDMQKRKEIIEDAKPNAVISIHMNKFSLKSRSGAQVFYKKSDEKAKLLANSIQKEFNGMESQKKKTCVLTGDYYILNCTEYPSVICECGFLSNAEDERLLVTEQHQSLVAGAIYKGVMEFLV